MIIKRLINIFTAKLNTTHFTKYKLSEFEQEMAQGELHILSMRINFCEIGQLVPLERIYEHV